MAHKGVPKFGSWEDEDRGEHLYTQYFENARKGKSPGRSVNPNNHHGDTDAPSKASPLRAGSDPAVRKLKDERRSNQEDDLRQHETTVCKPYAESPNHRYGAHTNDDNAARKTGIEKSPIHPRHQARVANKGGPERGSAVPKFGEWDEKDPSTGEGFTDIFEKVREEKQSGTGNAHVTTSEADYIKRYQQRKYESTHKGVPKFGSWEDEDRGEHLYTQYFENARKGKSPGRPVNPNNHHGDTDALSKASPLRAGSDPAVRKPKDERHSKSQTKKMIFVSTKPLFANHTHRYGAHTNDDNAARKTGIEKSPIHPRHQARVANKGGVSSPSRDRRGSSEGNRGSAPTTPGRSKFRPSGRGDETVKPKLMMHAINY
uniref:RIN4 pathogenic type III effector avirulence factor Avr cleavage site domain-containing protein n=1 Tax=Leersia perrieri TaxID=77586 RepID=A0A0D9W1D3_9ORYZ